VIYTAKAKAAPHTWRALGQKQGPRIEDRKTRYSGSCSRGAAAYLDCMVRNAQLERKQPRLHGERWNKDEDQERGSRNVDWETWIGNKDWEQGSRNMEHG